MSRAYREEDRAYDSDGSSTHHVQVLDLVRDDHLKVSKDYVFFANLNLDSKALEAHLQPFMELVAQRIAFTYKSPAKVGFQGTNGIYKLKLSDWLQFDDVCIKLLHVESGADVLFTVSTQIARSMLIRLLSTTLVDDSHGVLFSSTEKGILSFIIARLLLDLKHTLGDKMPDLKLIGIYHCQDETINDAAIANYGVFNFSFTFAQDYYPVSIALPVTVFNAIKPKTRASDVVGRCGHLSGVMTFTIAKLSMTKATVANLCFGDVIVFDRVSLKRRSGHLEGPLFGLWHGIAVHGALAVYDAHYTFVPNLTQGFARIEDITMEELEITGSDATVAISETTDRNHRKLADLAKNIRVPLSIELARIPLTLKELCQIREGEIIDLHRKIDDPLDLVVEGKVIGHCQPVQIDGRLGIRVLSIDDDNTETNS